MTTSSDNAAAPAPHLPSLGRLLGFATKAVAELTESRLTAHDLTLQQWIVLTALWRGDGLSIGDLAAYCQAREPTVSKLIDRMVIKDLVARQPDAQDRRVVRVRLTAKARDLAPLIDVYKDINARVLRGFSAEEIGQLTRSLERIAGNARSALAEPGGRP